MDSYWASKTEVKSVVDELWRRIDDYFQFLTRSGAASRAMRSWSTYYGRSPDGNKDTARLSAAGDGELVSMNTNHFAGLLTQAMVLTTSERPAFRAIAVSTGYGDKAQSQIAEGILEHYDRNLSLHKVDRAVCFRALLTGEGFSSWSWNPALGDTVADPETNQPVSEGDAEVAVHSLFDIAYDYSCGDFDAAPWVCIRKKVSKWELGAVYPQLAQEIYSGTGDVTDARFADFEWVNTEKAKLDVVDVWEFRHKPTAALPSGRLIKFMSPGCILQDTHTDEDGAPQAGRYPYGERLMVRRMAPEEVIGRTGGHTAFFDLLAQQEGIDLVSTIMATTVSTSGGSNLYVPRGANIKSVQGAGGFKIFEGTANMAPVAIETANVPKETLEFAQMCVQWMRQRTAINDVVMGEPTKGMPAQAMALLHAQALQFHSGAQESYQRYMEGSRTDLIDLLKAFANTKRTALVAGAANKWQLKEFMKTDIEGINRVYVEQVPAAAKSYAGKLSMAKDLLDMGMIQQPQQYIDLISTGQIKPMYEAEEANLMRIQAEMDLLRQGIGLCPVDANGNFVDDGKPHIRPTIFDTHWIDIPQYTSVINTPDSRVSPNVVKAVSDVILYKLRLWRQMDPALIVAMKGIPAPPLMDPANLGPSGGMGQQVPSGSPQQSRDGSPQNEAKLGGLNAQMGNQRAPGLPKPPQNPITGEKSGPSSDLSA